MGFLNNIFSSTKLSLTNDNRELIYKVLGSFNSNRFGMSSEQMIKNGYEKNIDFFSVVRLVKDAYVSIPTIVEKRNSDGIWEEIHNTSIHELMSQPNKAKGYTWADIDEMTMIYLLASGNNYTVGNTQFNRTLIEEIDILPPNFVEPCGKGNFLNPEIDYNFEIDTLKRTFTKEDLAHVRLFNPAFTGYQDSLLGLSLIQVAQDAIQVGNDRWEADSVLLQNKGKLGILTSDGDRPMSPDEAGKVQQAFNNDVGGARKFGQIKVSNKQLKYISLAMSSTDLQLIEKGVISTRAIANVIGVSTSLLNDPDNKKFANMKESEKALIVGAVRPYARKIEESYTNFIAKNHFPAGDVRMRKDYSGVEALQADKKVEAEKDKIVVDGINTVLSMNASVDTKKVILKETYDASEDLLNTITEPTNDII